MNSESVNNASGSIGIEVTSSECVGVCLSSDGAMIGLDRFVLSDPGRSVGELVAFVHELQSKYGLVGRVGVAVPGLIRRETGLSRLLSANSRSRRCRYRE